MEDMNEPFRGLCVNHYVHNIRNHFHAPNEVF